MEQSPLTCTITGGPAAQGPVICSCVGCSAAFTRQIEAAFEQGKKDRERAKNALRGNGPLSPVRFR